MFYAPIAVSIQARGAIVEMARQKETVGEMIRRLRKEKGLTQSVLAKAIGVDESYISKIEANKLSYNPSGDTLRLIATMLDVDPLELLGVANRAPKEMEAISESEQAREFFSLIRSSDVASDDWQDLTRVLRRRLSSRGGGGTGR